MKALKIKISQPTAHFRMPFTYQRRHTYPIPPYSTVLGFLCNLLGIDNQNSKLFKKLINCKLSVSGGFENKLTEYIWFRNMSKKSHKKYFGSETIRKKNGETEHIGGQSPMKIDVLENMEVTIHLTSDDVAFIKYLGKYLYNPEDRLETMHLGRAEDWLVFEDIQIIDLEKSSKHKSYNCFFWIPQHIWLNEEMIDEYNFRKIDGLFYNLPVFATIENYEKTYNRHAARTFDYLRVKLNDGVLKDTSYLFDGESPVFFADINKSS